MADHSRFNYLMAQYETIYFEMGASQEKIDKFSKEWEDSFRKHPEIAVKKLRSILQMYKKTGVRRFGEQMEARRRDSMLGRERNSGELKYTAKHTVIDDFYLILGLTRAGLPEYHPLNNETHPLHNPSHPLKDPTHPLNNPTHPTNDLYNPNRGVDRLKVLKKLIDENLGKYLKE